MSNSCEPRNALQAGRGNGSILSILCLLLLSAVIPHFADAATFAGMEPAISVSALVGCGSTSNCRCQNGQGGSYYVTTTFATQLASITDGISLQWSFLDSGPTNYFFFDPETIRCSADGTASHLFSTRLVLKSGASSTILTTLSASFTTLKVLDLSGMGLTGTIPAAFSSMTSLTYLDLSDNQLSGTIPAALGNLPALKVLDLSNNKFTGPIPSSLSSNANLQCLGLTNNQINGSVSPSFGSMANLAYLGLSYNDLTGELPTAITGSTSLQYLGLAHNHLTGELSSNVTQMPGLPLGSKFSCQSQQATCPGMYENNALFNDFAVDYVGESSICSGLALNDNSFSGSLPDLESISSSFPILLHNNNLDLLSSGNPVKGPKLSYSLSRLCETGLVTLSPQNVSNDPEVSCFGNCASGSCFPGYYGSAVFLNLSDIGSCSSAVAVKRSIDGFFLEHMITVGANKLGCEVASPPPPVTATPSPITPPGYCPPSSLPQPPFYCSSSGQWVSDTQVNEPLIVLPPNSVVTVNGGIDVITLSISGLNSSLSLNGCIRVNGSMTVTLSPEDLDLIKANGGRYTSLIASTSCSSPSFPVSVTSSSSSSSSSSCEQVVVSTESTPTSIQALFSISDEACKEKSKSSRWWIILISVVGGVLVIVGVISLLAKFNPKFQQAVRPFTKRETASAGGERFTS